MPANSLIRPSSSRDTERLIALWLSASRSSHHFIPAEFWQARAVDMEHTYLPGSETYVLEADGRVVGFLSLVGDHLAALFVDPPAQRLGYGKHLLGFAQALRSSLTLCVYSQNHGAVEFYRRAGFTVVEERVDVATGHCELLMEWAPAQPFP